MWWDSSYALSPSFLILWKYHPPDHFSYFKLSATIGDLGVCLLITLNRTDISKDAALELRVFLFTSTPLSCSVILLPFLKSLSFGMSSVFSGSPLSTSLSAFRPYPYLAPDKGFFPGLSDFLLAVDLEPFLVSQWDISCKPCDSQGGPHLPSISLLSHSFVHVSLNWSIIESLFYPGSLGYPCLGYFRIWLVIANPELAATLEGERAMIHRFK